NGVLSRIQCSGDVLVAGRATLLAGQKTLEPGELLQPTGVGAFLTEPDAGFLQDGEGPAALVNLLRGQVIDGLETISLFNLMIVERDDVGASTSLPRLFLRTFFGEEVLHRRLQENAETSALGIVLIEVALFQKNGEVTLGEVARLFGVDVVAPDEDVERVPVGATQRFERSTGLGGRTIPCGEYRPPTGRGE